MQKNSAPAYTRYQIPAEILDLETYIDHYYNMDTPPSNNHHPSKRKKADSSTDTDDLNYSKTEVSVLDSINTRLELLVSLKDDIKDIRDSLEFAHNAIVSLQQENHELKQTVKSLNNQMHTMSTEHKRLKETILDIQTRSMRDNLIFTGIPEKAPEDSESSLKNFMSTQLKLSPDTIQGITFHRVHRFGKRADNKPRPLIAKFEHFKDKELVKSKGRELKGTTFGINEQFPQEINERRKVTSPLVGEAVDGTEGSKVWAPLIDWSPPQDIWCCGLWGQGLLKTERQKMSHYPEKNKERQTEWKEETVQCV
ncbi:hypothetical protein WMY93_015998 [Mugilogobius chulae]|uniref:Uncharacterized protein n=1 Tax=Mugilogobius chulae TaxID=88201 RepID=A0AAW0P2L4_9GOBI